MTIALTIAERRGAAASGRADDGDAGPAAFQLAPVSNGDGVSIQLASDSNGDGPDRAGAGGEADAAGAAGAMPVGVPQVVQCVPPWRRPVPQTAHEAIVTLPLSTVRPVQVSDRIPPT